MKKSALFFSTVFFVATLAVSAQLKAGEPAYSPTSDSSSEMDTASFDAIDLSDKIQSGRYMAKVNNFLVVLDASTSMYSQHEGEQKFEQAKQLAASLNETIPKELQLQGGIRFFGPKGYDYTHVRKRLVYGMTDYSKAGFSEGLELVETTGGTTPIGKAIEAAGDDLANTSGNIALIVISDVEEVGGEPIEAIKKLKEQYGERICFYPIRVGDAEWAKEIMMDMANICGRGFATDYALLNTPTGMANFVEKVFLEEIGDSDRDGVADNMDRCPGTPFGTAVDKRGCTLAQMESVVMDLEVLFDHDTFYIKPEYDEMIKQFAQVMQKDPDTTATLEGHTDASGDEIHNQQLSVKRAESVKNYLTERFNVSANRIRVKGVGAEQPVASNETTEGRKQNRRVTSTFLAQL